MYVCQGTYDSLLSKNNFLFRAKHFINNISNIWTTASYNVVQYNVYSVQQAISL